MAKKGNKGKWDMEPQKSSAAQYLTYIASDGISDEKFEIRYEDENIWMSQKMLAAVYGVDLRTVSYHITKTFKDAELDENSVIQKYWITAAEGKRRRRKGTKAHAENAENAEGWGDVGEGVSASSALSARGKKSHAERGE